MDKIELTERQQRISDFRYGVIAELVFSHVEAAERSRLIAQKAARQWVIPYSSRTMITSSCIRKWVSAYHIHGRAALVPKIRKDTGVSRVLTDADKEAILLLLEQKPQLCASVAVKLLQKEGKLVKNVSRSALSRFLLASGAGREDRARSKTKDQILRYNFEMPLECVQADAMHSFQVPDHKGGLSKAILIAFIDDATRRIVYSRFCFTENALNLSGDLPHPTGPRPHPAALHRQRLDLRLRPDPAHSRRSRDSPGPFPPRHSQGTREDRAVLQDRPPSV